jgi:PASTA domain
LKTRLRRRAGGNRGDEATVVQAQRTFPTFLNRVGILLGIAVAFTVGLFGTIYLSLRSPEVKVPEVVGKNYMEAETALEQAGLKLRKRATRYSAEAKPDTVLDQTPHGGDVVKEGQTVAVVVSRAEQKEGESSVGLAAKEAVKQADKGGNQNANQNGNDNANAAANANNANRPKRNRNTNRNANQNGNANGNGNASAVANSNLDNRLTLNRNDNAAGNRNAAARPNANLGPGVNANRPTNTDGTAPRNGNTNSNRPAGGRNTNANGTRNTNTPRPTGNTNRRPPLD